MLMDLLVAKPHGGHIPSMAKTCQMKVPRGSPALILLKSFSKTALLGRPGEGRVKVGRHKALGFTTPSSRQAAL